MSDYSYSKDLANQVKAYLDSQNWTYEFNEERGVINYGLNIRSKLKTIDVYIRIDERYFIVHGVARISADDETKINVAEYFTRANYGLTLGCFEMDFSDGELRYKSALWCGDTVPSIEVVEHVVDVASAMWERYGDGLLACIFAKALPKDEIEKIEAPAPAEPEEGETLQ